MSLQSDQQNKFVQHPMSWDHSLLRKFSCTGHFRLLSQVRSELRAQFLNRDPVTRNLQIQLKPLRGVSSRSIRRPNALSSVDQDRSLLSDMNEGPKSFRERLHAIDMR